MKHWFMLTGTMVLGACAVAAGEKSPAGPFEPSWDSLKRYTVPEWYLDAKFGIFIHWGVYSVPAFGSEWYPRNMYQKGTPDFVHHVKTFGEQSKFGYKDFVPMFKAEKWDPKAWASLFRKAGAKYVVPVAEHHDGFAMYDTGLCEWSAAKMGPKRDIVGELAQAVRDEGLVFGLSSHRAEHWWFFNGGRQFDSDVNDPSWDALYGPAQPEKGPPPNAAYLDNWLARCLELVDKYRPQVFWFDWWIEQPVFEPYRQQFAAYYYNRAAEWGQGVAINYKNASFPPEAAVLDIERGKLDKMRDLYWQTDTSVSIKSWGYIENDRFRSVSSLLHELIDIVGKNGCLLLNIGPRSDGTIPKEVEEILLGMGQWLDVNGEAIYGTRPWIVAAEGPTEVASGSFSDHREKPFTAEDVRFTAKGDAIYALAMGWPDKTFEIESLGKKNAAGLEIADVRLLGCGERLKWKQAKNALAIEPPAARPCDHAYAFKVTVRGRVFGATEAVLDAGNRIAATAAVGNYDAQAWTEDLELLIDGKPVAAKTCTIPAGGKSTVTIDGTIEKPGRHRVAIGKGKLASAPAEILAPYIDLAGEWRFQKGDSPEWNAPTLDDREWEKVNLPAHWEDHSNYIEDKAYGWYRKTVVIPREWKGLDLVLPLGKIDDVDETFFNGTRIGGCGSFPPATASAFQAVRRYTVPAKLIRWGKENTIAIRCYDDTGQGGLYAGPLGPVTAR